MSTTFILILSWSLIIFAAFTVGAAFRTLAKGTHKPIRTGLEAIITVLFFGLAITVWNTDIPVWIWWILVAGISLLAGATVMSTVKVREEKRR